MNHICRVCNKEITGRETSAKVCWPCYYSKPKRDGQAQAASKVNRAVKKGLLPHVSTLICVDCGKTAQCYEHRDYNKPLEVEPTCKSCNTFRGPAISLNKETITK